MSIRAIDDFDYCPEYLRTQLSSRKHNRWFSHLTTLIVGWLVGGREDDVMKYAHYALSRDTIISFRQLYDF